MTDNSNLTPETQRLTLEQRREANSLVDSILENPDWAAFEIIGLRAQLAAREKRLEEVEGHAAAWKQSWRDAKDQAYDLASAVLGAPYTPASLEKWNSLAKLAQDIVGDPAALAAGEEK